MYSTNVKHQRSKRYQQLRKEMNEVEAARTGYFTDGNYKKLRDEYYSICMYADHHCNTCDYETWSKRYSNKVYRAKCKNIIQNFFSSGEEDLLLPVWNKYRKGF